MNRTRKIPLNNSVDLKGNKITKSRSIGPGTSVTTTPYANGNTNAGSNLIRLAVNKLFLLLIFLLVILMLVLKEQQASMLPQKMHIHLPMVLRFLSPMKLKK